MSNNYDIEIKMDYFYESDSYEDMLEKKKNLAMQKKQQNRKLKNQMST